jgi:NTP pyrophosphatase (non-canonical NTP hydrolase)
LNTNDYANFVRATASDESKYIDDYVNRLYELNKTINVAMLHTGSAGLASEGGEFAEICKKVTFQGKLLDEATLTHMKKELGDIAWYWALACLAVGSSPEEILRMNVEKLEARYPNGFEVVRSENRAEGDI